mmetsp:Transcript_139825/g.241595  ORF Transcript_139825/g.241595 Transcript_139825/m.241595 type:complete len:85 (+) Transcript_139825:175-429(+)
MLHCAKAASTGHLMALDGIYEALHRLSPVWKHFAGALVKQPKAVAPIQKGIAADRAKQTQSIGWPVEKRIAEDRAIVIEKWIWE